MSTLRIDIETHSSVDLLKCGVFRYVEAPDFEVMLFGYAYGDSTVTVVDLAQGETIPQHVLRDLEDPATIKKAFNANFEITCLSVHLGRQLDPAQWRCTQVQALYLGLPGSLAQVGKVLGLDADKQKMASGMSLIRYFCIPCKATKANGGRTRNRPQHDPAKWALFKSYCGRDVESEREVDRKTERFPVPQSEQDLWVLDQKMNRTGVAVDTVLVANAIRFDAAIKERLTAEAIQLTGLDNPSSREQLLAWLQEEMPEGEEVLADITKKTVKKLLSGVNDSTITRVLELRQELAKSSTSKYEAMARAVCNDGRIRGLTQFYGANRTGRWAGRLVQFQNLPQNKLRDIDLARNLLIAGDLDMFELLFGNVPDTLSQLIRTAFVARSGHKFVDVDFSAIEARMLAWLSNCKWRLEVFATHGKIYEASAEQMFKLPPGSVTKKSPYRQKGKVAELACFAAETLVLTRRGYKQITDITVADQLWDGVDWTTSGGAICQGTKKVINLCGVEVTPDHLIRTGPTWTPAQALASNESTLCRALATGLQNSPSWVLSEPSVEPATLTWSGSNAPAELNPTLYLITTCAKGKARGAMFALKNKLGIGGKTTLSTRMFAQTIGTAAGFLTDLLRAKSGAAAKMMRATQTMAGEAFAYSAVGLRTRLSSCATSLGYPAGMSRFMTSTASMSTEATSLGTSGSYPGGKTGGPTNAQSAKAKSASQNLKPVFDILNCGSRNTFTILTNRGPLLVHNCGYQGGPNALKTMGALEMGLTEDELQPIINQWREANPEVVQFWYACERAAKDAVSKKTSVVLPIAGGKTKLVFAYESGFLTIKLPVGRKLFYVKPRIEQEDLVRELANGSKYVVARAGSVTYEGQDQKTKQWTRVSTYGGKLVENLCQAISRDCLAVSMLRLEEAGFNQLVTVHDQDICEEHNPGPRDVRLAEQIMSMPIDWAPGLDLRADGFETSYHMKEIE
jgi:DNA polymerase